MFRPMRRRDFLHTTAGATLVAVLPLPRCAAARRLDRIGLQLYTVRAEMARDFEGTLARVAEMGYGEVEFAGYFGRTPAQVRAALAGAGLTAPASHVPFEILREGWDGVLDTAAAAGHTGVVVPWIPQEERPDLDGWRRVADLFNGAGERARARGLRFAYHNHDFEFAPVGGQVPYDVLLEATDPALVAFEMDLYWTVKGGHGPLAYFAAHPGRFQLVHVKDSAGPPDHRMVDLGRGTIDFAAIFARSAEAGIRHWFVEHDEPADPLAFCRDAFAYLRRLEF
jgi:sugar phosphate isomerase/epimerase